MNEPFFDVLVIGSGIAGLTFALEAASGGSVGVVTKKDKAESATNYAQGGIAAAVGAKDSVELHIRDTLRAGAGLCNPEIVRIVAEEGPEKIARLMEWGAHFSQSGGKLDLGREGGHSTERIVHKDDYTGHEVERALLEEVRRHDNITLFENSLAVDVVTDRHLDADIRPRSRRCYGAYVFNHDTGKVDLIRSRVVMLATGGMGCVWLHTTNPAIATGDGVAMAWRAGARLANLEFMQFHPTALYTPNKTQRAFLISEAVRGFGAHLLNQRGERFMIGQHELAELAPRDIVARAIDNERKKWGIEHVWLDITHRPAGQVRERFPMICKTLKEQYGIDMTAEPVPVVPAAHYQCGGVVVDAWARSTVERLFAAGEVAHTGLHGANRLASNSLLEAVVFGARAAKTVIELLQETKGETLPEVPPWDDSGTYDPEEWVLTSHDRGEIQKLMEDYVGIVRSDLRLERAERRLDLITREIEDYWRRTVVSPELVELRNTAQVARLVIRCAMMRKESRGLHFTTDYPRPDDVLGARDTVI
ncbi:MAG TPA: L-aspartate oxidase [Bacteroidetes bacterium]|nr:L-aspartate oxidase [Bacteroidota bacterium]